MSNIITLTRTESRMLDAGYLSARMIAYKCGRHVATVRRAMRVGELAVHQVGQQQFTLIAEVERWIGSSAKLFDFRDWSLPARSKESV